MRRNETKNNSAKRIALHRRKNRREGMTRLEVTVPRHDAGLIRGAAQTLREGGNRALRLREQLSTTGKAAPARNAKELLAFFQNSPLAKDDIDLTRDRSSARDVDL